MADTRKRSSNADLQGTLCVLRREIDTVPKEDRAILWAVADRAQNQHERMQMISTRIEDLVTDIGLIVEHTRFHVAACRREFQATFPHVACAF